MKKAAIYILSLILALSVCFSGVVMNVARAEDGEGDEGDGEYAETYGEGGQTGEEDDDFNQEEGEIPDDAEPQIWLYEGVHYHDPEYSTTDGTNNDPNEEPLDRSVVPEELIEGLLYVTHTTVGTIVIRDNGLIYRLRDNEIIEIWPYDVKAGDRIFDVSGCFDDPQNRWYGYIGNSLVHFTEDRMVVDVVECTEFDFSDKGMYCYHIENSILYATSPCNNTPIIGEVIEIYTKEGHTFMRRPDGVYLLTVSPYLISQMSQQYCDEHPVPYIYLGDEDWYGYYMKLDTRNSGKSQEETTRDFDVYYGITDVTWGHPTTTFSPKSVELAAGKNYWEVYDYYDIAVERDGGSYFKIPDIDFGPLQGTLSYEFQDLDPKNPASAGFYPGNRSHEYKIKSQNNIPSRVTWESYNASEEVFDQVRQFLDDSHYACMGETDSGAGDKEYSYVIDGGFIMHVVYKSSMQEGDHVFVYVDY